MLLVAFLLSKNKRERKKGTLCLFHKIMHSPINTHSTLFCVAEDSQYEAPKPPTHALHAHTYHAVNNTSSASDAIATPALAMDSAAVSSAAHPVVTSDQASLRTNWCAHLGRVPDDEAGCRGKSQALDVVKGLDSKAMHDSVSPLANRAEATTCATAQGAEVEVERVVAKPPTSARPAVARPWRHPSAWHASSSSPASAAAATKATAPAVLRLSTSTRLPFDDGAELISSGPVSSDNASDVFNPAPASTLLVSGPVDCDDDDTHYAQFLNDGARRFRGAAVSSQALKCPLPSSTPANESADGGCTPHWTGDEKACNAADNVPAATHGGLVTGTLSSYLTADGWDQASLLQSPLTDSLHPPPSPSATTTTTTTAAAVEQMTSAAGPDHYADCDGTSSLFHYFFPISSPFSPELQAVLQSPAQKNPPSSPAATAASAASENWEAKRLRRVSATWCSSNSSVMSPSMSPASSATLRSPLVEAWSNSVSGYNGRINSKSGRGRARAASLASDTSAPYWTSVSPEVKVATMAAPLLPRTFSAPPSPPDVPLRNHAQGYAADSHPPRLQKKNPMPPLRTEGKQRWHVPLSMRCVEARDSQQPPWFVHHSGRRSARPQQDSIDDSDALPTH